MGLFDFMKKSKVAGKIMEAVKVVKIASAQNAAIGDVESPITDFVFKGKVEESTIEKYRGKIPDEMIEFWEKYGYGTILNGYLKIVNPDDYIELMEEATIYFKECPVIFTTGMGELIFWRNDDTEFVGMLDFRHGETKALYAGFESVLEYLRDGSVPKEELKWNPYPEAVKLYGPLEYDECFGYAPLLGIGGSEKVENLKKVKLYEHIGINIAFLGPLGLLT